MRSVRVGLGRRSYRIRIVRGSLEGLGRRVASTFGSGRRVAVMSDRNVAALYGADALASLQSAGIECELFVHGVGERAKRVRTAERAWSWLLERGFDRRSTLVLALGGGVVGDVAGFVASTYMRGVDLVAVPTTVLAQVDSSVGGKTGFNLPGAKNVVGTFHQPRLVYTALATLRTLRPRDFRAGLAEVVKHGVIGRPGILAQLRMDGAAVRRREAAVMESLVATCCEVKRDVVEQDEREAGLRQILNFGHTFGHAIEVATRHRMRHGEAVALGMVSACRVSEALGYCDRGVRDELVDVLREVGLDGDDRPWFRPEVVAMMSKDKKFASGYVSFITLRGVGKVEITPLRLEELDRIVHASH